MLFWGFCQSYVFQLVLSLPIQLAANEAKKNEASPRLLKPNCFGNKDMLWWLLIQIIIMSSFKLLVFDC